MRGEYHGRVKKIPDFGEWRATGGYTVIYGKHPEPGVEYRVINDAEPIEVAVGDILLPPSLSVSSTFLHDLHHLRNLPYLHNPESVSLKSTGCEDCMKSV
jgi:hypothetical protein